MPDSPRLESQLLTVMLGIKSDVSAIKQRQEEDHDRLFGNGQPGELDKLDSRVKTIELRDAEERGRNSANKRWSGYISAAVSAAVTAGAEWLFHRNR